MSLTKAEELVKDLISSDKYFDIEYDSSQTIKGLTKIPVISKYAFSSAPKYQLLSEAQKEGNLKIKETGVVKELEILNQSQYPVFIPCGSLFVSQGYGLQDRSVITDVMVEKESKTKIPVVCVESGRWTNRSSDEVERILGSKRVKGSDFSSGILVPMSVNYALHSSTTRYLVGPEHGEFSRVHDRRNLTPRRRTFQADQGLVWGKVDEEIQQADAKTPTSSLTEVYVKKDKDSKVEFEIYENEIGNIFVGDNRVLSMEVYHNPTTWQSMAESTIKRYKMGIRKEQEPKREMVDSFLSDLSKCKPVAVESIGLGYDVRLIEGKADGSCLVVDQAPIHFTAIPGVKKTREPIPSRIPMDELFREIYRRGSTPSFPPRDTRQGCRGVRTTVPIYEDIINEDLIERARRTIGLKPPRQTTRTYLGRF